MARVFDRGLTVPSGFVLPIQRWQARAMNGARWRTEKWKTRRGQLFLVPGDSPVGYRLPLGSLPYIAPSAFPHVVPLDPTIPRCQLPDPSQPAFEVPNIRLKDQQARDRLDRRVRLVHDIDALRRDLECAHDVEARDQQYQAAVDRFCGSLQGFCHRYGLDYIRTSTSTPFEDLVLKYLRRAGLVA